MELALPEITDLDLVVRFCGKLSSDNRVNIKEHEIVTLYVEKIE
ncbi:unnamed protein product [uncultured virus]|nr:unnamed protein product [uncultured virus]